MKQRITPGARVRTVGLTSDSPEYDEGTVIEIVSAGFTNSSARVRWDRAQATYIESLRDLEVK